jgi:hypothetical protein
MTGVFILFMHGFSFVRIEKGDDRGLHFDHTEVLNCRTSRMGDRGPHLCKLGKEMTGVFIFFMRGSSFEGLMHGHRGLHFVHAGVLICRPRAQAAGVLIRANPDRR